MSDIQMGKAPWELTQAHEETIYLCAKQGLKEHAIARAVGLYPTTFSTKKNDFPQIQEIIDKGRIDGQLQLMQFTWWAASNPSSSAQKQEMDRLHRLFKTEKLDDDEEQPTVTQTNSSTNGFTIEVVTRSNVNN